MTTGYQKTPEERMFDQFIDEEWESLSEAARTFVGQAMGIASKWHLIDNISYMPEWQEEEKKAMRRTATEPTRDDCEGLTKIWRSALAAAASIEPYDFETHL